ncbi:MAG: 23S rRNA (uracil(1939)-C(5))-methyltransferase RlmD [Acholeplasmatales bacterium]|jgi:23S rRNA (uracil1939-C5)-methyltransferase|nr:23S rRNA (uracil(1939)-C(5))-methyltransferase RlmD [Acholeplasmatales bacterium]
MNLDLNQELELEIKRVGINGEGIGYFEKKAVFVPEALPNERVKIKILKIADKFSHAELIEVIRPSSERIKPKCSDYSNCGACQLQHAKNQGEIKSELLLESLCKYSSLANPKKFVDEIILSDKSFYYRNKAMMLVRDYNNPLGFYKTGTNHFISTPNCILHMKIIGDILKEIPNVIKASKIVCYDERRKKGELMSVLIRCDQTEEKVMIMVGVSSLEVKLDKFFELLTNKFPVINSIYKTVIDIKDNPYYGDEIIHVGRETHLDLNFMDYKFRLLPRAFFQLNYLQAEKFYQKIIKLAGVKKTDIVIDAYAGIGIIGILVSKFVKRVFLNEIDKDCLESAKTTIELNGITNITILPGDFVKAINGLDKKTVIDCLFVDPPRSGLIDYTGILKLRPKRIVYGSCNTATLSKDIKVLSEFYFVTKIVPLDMFPNTSHVESILLLNLKSDRK